MDNNLQIVFTSKSIPIPADYRPLFKIGHIILILELACRSNKSSLMKLHFLAWAIKSERNMNTVQDWIANSFKNDFHIWGIEPTINRAIIYAIADKLIDDFEGQYILTEKGAALYKAIKKDKELFVTEKQFLSKVGKNTITEARVVDLANKFF